MAMVAEETANKSRAVKRMKIGNEKLSSPSSTFEKTKTIDREIYVNSAPEDPSDSCDSGGVPASCLSSSGTMEKLKVADLEESFESETAAAYKLDGSESTQTSEFKAESVERESTTAKQLSVTISSCRTVMSPEKLPPEAELEAFFAAAEEGLNKRFKDKYNYDIVHDIPLKGRFDWIQVAELGVSEVVDGGEGTAILTPCRVSYGHVFECWKSIYRLPCGSHR
ncbi:hypothetical protein L2E82_33614 [Cichorium intybus]|uniref:Uncharacterized protein n=1 Tax=Cichorium intybus TaxID=13427 RepID=A0ACB9BL13_CICIN|nr:hypothetical protein L2E82_33614 [Cichorium intybus]